MKYIISFILITFSFSIVAQNITDALRYSNLEVGGTARTVGVGGAIGALGADYAVLSTNPAGLAAFRTNEFVITPSVFNAKTTSLLETGNGNSANDLNFTNFNLANVGIVLNNRPRRGKWTTFNFGIGYNRLATFNQEFEYKGRSQGSIVQRFTELANDGIFDQFEVNLAEQVIAIYSDDNNPDVLINDFESADINYQIDREQFVKTRGSYSELVFSVGGNYDEKLMVGATVGVPLINYELEKVYKESELEGVDDVPFFDNLEFQENINTSGVGINLKIGAIYRINQMFRVGAAFHSPTVMSLNDGFSNQLNYVFTDADGTSNETADSPDGSFDYRFTSPWRAIGSFAVLVNRKGFISADIEYVDYSSASFNLTTNSNSIEDQAYEEDLNLMISNDLQPTLNFRLGGEYAYNRLRLRGGVAISGTPYADSDITNSSYSLGVGFRERSYYLDFAFRNNIRNESYTPFLLANPAEEQVVSNEVTNTQLLLTLGFKF